MKTKTFVIPFIVVFVIILCFAFGKSKDKAEAIEPEIKCPHNYFQGCLVVHYDEDGRQYSCMTCTECGKDVSEINAEAPKPEPNEPEYRILSISERINNTIPTWPDYIELEKMLVIDQKCIMPDGTYDFFELRFGKGTKIYFKED